MSDRRLVALVMVAMAGVTIAAFTEPTVPQRTDEADPGPTGPTVSPRDHMPIWAPDGGTVYFASSRSMEARCEPAAFRVGLADLRIWQLTPPGVTCASVSPSGRYLLLGDSRFVIAERRFYWRVLDLETGRYASLQTDTRHAYGFLRFGPTDGELVFTHRAQSRPSDDIYAADLVPSTGEIRNYRPVLRHAAPLQTPVWSMDGRQLAYVLNPYRVDDDTERFSVAITVLEPEVVARAAFELGADDHVQQVTWFPDNVRLMILADGHWCIANTETGELTDYRQLLRANGHLGEDVLDRLSAPLPSPDGSDDMLVGVRVEKNPMHAGQYLAIMHFDGSGLRQITDEAAGPIPQLFPEMGGGAVNP